MFYTGTSREDAGERQTVCMAVSADLMVWEKSESNPIVSADARWYQTLAGGFTNEPFRDPWVFKLPGQDEWTMLTTAADRNAHDQRQRGLMGVAKSKDLLNWQVQPPSGSAGQGFGETEVFQFEIVDGVPILLFCCGPIWLSEERKNSGELGGVYSLPVAPDLSDVDFNRATLFPNTSLYASRLIQGKDGGWNLIAFVNEVNGRFVGELSNPIPVTADPVRGLVPKNA
jgi:beta-fructofuranosidase